MAHSVPPERGLPDLLRPSPYQAEDGRVGALVKDARLVAEADAPADEEVPVGVVVKAVVHDSWEAQHHITEEGRVLHHLGESW